MIWYGFQSYLLMILPQLPREGISILVGAPWIAQDAVAERAENCGSFLVNSPFHKEDSSIPSSKAVNGPVGTRGTGEPFKGRLDELFLGNSAGQDACISAGYGTHY